jgi:iron complex outermembrane receptor protein
MSAALKHHHLASKLLVASLVCNLVCTATMAQAEEVTADAPAITPQDVPVPVQTPEPMAPAKESPAKESPAKESTENEATEKESPTKEPPAKEVEFSPVIVSGSGSVAVEQQAPMTTESISRQQMDETINLVNTEDALKYLPSVMVRKRNIGDTQSPITTRTSGPGQSARSLIFADGVLLSALIGNNNSQASPRWSMVAPEEIERIDVMYGPFSAAYAGNSIGAVIEMTTRMPQQFEASVKVQAAQQHSTIYGTSDDYLSGALAATLGNRSGAFSWWLSTNHLDTHTQPITIATATRATTNTNAGRPVTGAYMDVNKFGAPIAVVGAGGIEHKLEDTFKVKLAYDFTPTLIGSYTVGLFQLDDRAEMQTYLRDAGNGDPVYSGSGNGNASINIGGDRYVINTPISNGTYNFIEDHLMQSVTLKSSTQGHWDWQAVASTYSFVNDHTRTPGSAAAALSGSGAGSNVSMDGTGWNTLDLKGIWRPRGISGAHQASFGAHHDQQTLVTTRYNTANWTSGSNGSVITDARGKTQTQALWMQDVWHFSPDYKATLGGRFEDWRAYDGSLSQGTPAAQPERAESRFSPKAALAWTMSDLWIVSGALGIAYRFPTVGELYQAVTTGNTTTIPNPNLRPERALSSELALERAIDNSKLRLSLFREELRDALISQNTLLAGSSTFGASVQNVDKIRAHGVELAVQQEDAFIAGLRLSGSVTYVNSKIVSDPTFRNSANAPANVSGNRTPNIPALRLTAVAHYRINEKLTTTAAVRYSTRLYTTIDNSDPVTSTYGGFDPFLVMDVRVHYNITKKWTAAVGIDNLNNEKYWLFHPFPQRSLIAEAKYKY